MRPPGGQSEDPHEPPARACRVRRSFLAIPATVAVAGGLAVVLVVAMNAPAAGPTPDPSRIANAGQPIRPAGHPNANASADAHADARPDADAVAHAGSDAHPCAGAA